MMIGRLAAPEGSVGRGASFLVLSCAFKPVASDAAIAEPRNPRRLMDMNSPNSGNGEKDNTARWWRAGCPRPAERARRPLLHHLQHASHAFANNCGFGNQTQHEMSFVWKIVKVAGMDDHTRLAQQADGQIFVTLEGGYAQNNVPSALDHQSCARRMACKLAIEFREIHAQTIKEDRLDLFALIEQHRSGKLNRSV